MRQSSCELLRVSLSLSLSLSLSISPSRYYRFLRRGEMEPALRDYRNLLKLEPPVRPDIRPSRGAISRTRSRVSYLAEELRRCIYIRARPKVTLCSCIAFLALLARPFISCSLSVSRLIALAIFPDPYPRRVLALYARNYILMKMRGRS